MPNIKNLAQSNLDIVP